MKIFSVLKDWVKRSTEAQTWDEVRNAYSEYSKQPEYRQYFESLIEVIDQILNSKYRDVFYPLRTMDGLILSMSKTIRFGQQNILIRGGETLTFEYQDSGPSWRKKGWVRTCLPRESIKLLDKLNEHIKITTV